jgi:glycosyltransferase involved in cell wall biosynthesis
MIKNVCIVTDYYPPHIGGQEILFQKIAQGIAERGINCFVITTKTFYSDKTVESKNDLTIIRISVPNFLPRFWFAILSMPKILSLRKNIDIIHGTSYSGVLPVFFTAKLLKKKSIITIHEFMGEKWKEFESNPFSAWFYSTAETFITKMPFDRFIAVSNYTQLQLKSYGINDDRINLIYNGSNDDVLKIKLNNSFLRKELGFNENDFIFLACGRAGLTKGIQYFIEAMPAIIKNIENAKFIFILSKADKRIW